MSADKAGFHTQTFYLLVDDALYTAHICENGVGAQVILEIFQILDIKFHRGTQENIIAACKTLIMFLTYSVDHIGAYC